ncbi:hypothetical protein Pmani_010111 [Petrolisthes manimaculis]|uniref:Chitin-binding type-2 domain-containing protein n=1 Tax=Petrolisthes manimaculis TaxID=1843537 RepID=A0AAE1UH39_9EUCA|nr:hypothetical protein Pmani_010111 [Petrolisthes manimaculis]
MKGGVLLRKDYAMKTSSTVREHIQYLKINTREKGAGFPHTNSSLLDPLLDFPSVRLPLRTMAGLYSANMAVAVVAVVLAVATLTLADSSPSVYELPSNATVINGGPIVTGFSCDELPYGYYADTANGCRIFHICYPYLDPEQFVRTRMWSFICGLGTVFSQVKLVCDFPEYTIPCEDSPNFYESSNGYFGTDLQFGV